MPQHLLITDEFQLALDLLAAGSDVFITGKAGTGKSTLIRHFLETTDRNTVTVAPTGIAALNVDGYTIHRLFSFHTGIDEAYVRAGNYYPGRFASALKKLDTLIIDEASMVRADLFDALAAALERFGPTPGERFGGVQLVLVGDLYQLPPVVTDAESEYIETRYGTPFFFSAHAFDSDLFPTVELTTVFRQQGDTRLVDILNDVREGTLLETARAELNTRTDREFDPDPRDFWLTLATTNRIVRARNRQMLERLDDESHAYAARITGDLDGFEHPADDTLTLKLGAQVMILANDPADRYANGTLGHVAAIDDSGDEPVITVRLRDGSHVDIGPHTWEVTRPVADGGGLSQQVVGTFTQLPMKLAWAVTIHKSQGQTLDRVIVDLTGGTFANGQLYVALSRCTSFTGLKLRRPVLARDLKTDPRIRRFLSRSAPVEATLGDVYISALTVGNEGSRFRPRPIEIAVVTDDGDEATTVVNPTSDLYNAHSDYGLTTRDVQLAPVLAEAWAALSPLVAGRIPVGVGIDHLLGLLDFELKRNCSVDPMPLGREIPQASLSPGDRARLRAPSALERVRAVRDVDRRAKSAVSTPDGSGSIAPGAGTAQGTATAPEAATIGRTLPADSEGGTPFSSLPRGQGYLMARSTGPEGVRGPDGFTVGGNLSPEDDPAQVLADLLHGAWERVIDRDQTCMERLRGVERHFGIEVLPEGFMPECPLRADDVLHPGTRVCFTGTVVTGAGRVVDREDMEVIAMQNGLQPVANVTKTKSDVLVVAERGSQSRKARNAAAFGKPILLAGDFLEWAGREDG